MGNSSPAVSIVVVNWNGGPLLRRCIEAALASTLPVEVILCDNASGDGSHLAAVAGHPEVRLIANARNLGFATAANQGIRAATGDFILLLNPDCLLEPDTLERMLQAMAGHPRAGMAGCRILNPDGSEQRGCRRRLPDMGNSLGKALGRQRGRGAMDLHQAPLPAGPACVEAISGAFMLVRRAALAQVGPLDPGYFMHCEDLDWCRRFQQAGWKILFVPGVTVIHHQGTCSRGVPVRVSWHKHRGMVRYYRKHLAIGHNPVARAGVIGAIYARFLMTLPLRRG